MGSGMGTEVAYMVGMSLLLSSLRSSSGISSSRVVRWAVGMSGSVAQSSPAMCASSTASSDTTESVPALDGLWLHVEWCRAGMGVVVPCGGGDSVAVTVKWAGAKLFGASSLLLAAACLSRVTWSISLSLDVSSVDGSVLCPEPSSKMMSQHQKILQISGSKMQ